MSNMTKRAAERVFRAELKNFPKLRRNLSALRDTWNRYTDMLCKENRITEKQYNRWCNPF